MKVKILRDTNIGDLERSVNTFLPGKEIIDIKLSEDGHNVVVLIMYK